MEANKIMECKSGKDGKREGRNEGGIKGNGENHRGTCGRWNQVKNENHIMATQTHACGLFELGWVERKADTQKEKQLPRF